MSQDCGGASDHKLEQKQNWLSHLLPSPLYPYSVETWALIKMKGWSKFGCLATVTKTSETALQNGSYLPFRFQSTWAQLILYLRRHSSVQTSNFKSDVRVYFNLLGKNILISLHASVSQIQQSSRPSYPSHPSFHSSLFFCHFMISCEWYTSCDSLKFLNRRWCQCSELCALGEHTNEHANTQNEVIWNVRKPS